MSKFAHRLERSVDAVPDRFPPWYFGIPHLDEVVKGVRAGFVNLVVARPHVGKTLLALAGIRNNSEIPTLLISADDDPDVVVRKMMFYDGLVPSVEDAWKVSSKAMSSYVAENYPNLDIVDNVSWGPTAWNGKITPDEAIERFMNDTDEAPQFIVYDYLGIEGADFARTMEIAAWQKEMFRKLPQVGLVIAQSNRQGSKYEKNSDGQMVRRGFRMEDLGYGGEQQAGLMIGLSRAQAFVDGRVQYVIEADVVKNKAVFDGSGITDPLHPVVLCHHKGRLTDKRSIEMGVIALDEYQRQEARRAALS